MAIKVLVLATRAAAIAARKLVDEIAGELVDGTPAPFPRGVTDRFIRVVRNQTTNERGIVLNPWLIQAAAGTLSRLTPAKRTTIRNYLRDNTVNWTEDWGAAVDDDE